MKRLVLLVIAVLCCRFALAQDIESASSDTELTVIARLDTDFGSVTPSLYTLFEGPLGGEFSYSVCNHWLTDFESTGDLYRSSFRSDNLTWCDWANITWAPSNFSFTLGKQYISMGTLEEDAYDFDSHYELNTLMWNELNLYQWGLAATYTDPETESYAAAYVSSSPYSMRPFENGAMTFALFGNLNSTIGSANNSLLASGHYFNSIDETIFAIGDCLEINGFKLTLDAYSRGPWFNGDRSNSIAATLAYNFNDRFEVGVKDAYDKVSRIFDNNTIGGYAYWYPLHESTALRVHALGAYRQSTGNAGFLELTDSGFTFNIGVMYKLSLNGLFN